MAKINEKCDCCCGKNECKEVKMYFCPKCRSHDVKMIFAFRNIFGMIPRWKCRKCGFENMTFPIAVYNEKSRDRAAKSKRGRK